MEDRQLGNARTLLQEDPYSESEVQLEAEDISVVKQGVDGNAPESSIHLHRHSSAHDEAGEEDY